MTWYPGYDTILTFHQEGVLDPLSNMFISAA
jgi:hypothetical protein